MDIFLEVAETVSTTHRVTRDSYERHCQQRAADEIPTEATNLVPARISSSGPAKTQMLDRHCGSDFRASASPIKNLRWQSDFTRAGARRSA
jgi:hypothetical protein